MATLGEKDQIEQKPRFVEILRKTVENSCDDL
jgi:hypothetical protein